MEKYTIFCTEKQTKKALELGAPILGLSSMTKEDITTIQCVKLDTPIHTDVIEGGFDYAIIPTAEQMIGWLEEQLQTQISISFDEYRQWFFNLGYGNFTALDTRKEATLAAIDEALEYLKKQKE